ncbi:MAG: hypothetical protein ACYCS9_08190 [Candidatus Dormibacteria bacterium]
MRPSRATVTLAWTCLQNLLAADMLRDVDPDQLLSAFSARDLGKQESGLPREQAAAAVLQQALDDAGPKGLATPWERARLAYSLSEALGYLGQTHLDLLPERNSPENFPPLAPGEARAAYLVRVAESAKRAARELLYPSGGGMRVARNVGWFYGYCVAGRSLRHLAAATFPENPDAADAKSDRHTQVRAGISVAANILQVKVRWRSAQGGMG